MENNRVEHYACHLKMVLKEEDDDDKKRVIFMAVGGTGTYIHYVCMEIVEHTFQITTTQYFFFY